MINPWILIVIGLLGIVMYYTVVKGTKVMIESQRRDAESRGPINNVISTVVNGLVSVRAAERMGYFRQDFLNNLQYGTNATFCYVIANRWIGIRLDMMCCIFICFLSFFIIAMKGSVDNSLLVMSLQVSLDLISLFSISFRMYAEIENNMTSSQRIVAYTKLD